MIILNRDPKGMGRLRKWKIMLDEIEVGKIAFGEKKSFQVEPGQHVLYIKIYWGRSNKVNFENTKDETISFKCVSSARGLSSILEIFYAFIFFNRYIKLERTNKI
jgi:hypothetical protein